jgi:predicted O-methyltransferase YrrM
MMLFDRNLLVLVFVIGIIFLVSLIGYQFYGAAIYSVTIAMTSVLVCILVLEAHRRIRNDMRSQTDLAYKQLEAYIALVDCLQPKIPLPNFRGWSASPDFLKLVTDTVLSREPPLVLEYGSGTSTIVVAYCLRRMGAGRLITLEHEKVYVERTRAMLRAHDLEQWAEVKLTPLVKRRIGTKDWLWYNFDLNTLPGSLDMLLVDGPPHNVQHLARYPAYPMAASRLSPDWILIMDDGLRESEQAIVKLWDEAYTDISCRYVDLEKGCFLISPNADCKSNDRC